MGGGGWNKKMVNLQQPLAQTAIAQVWGGVAWLKLTTIKPKRDDTCSSYLTSYKYLQVNNHNNYVTGEGKETDCATRSTKEVVTSTWQSRGHFDDTFLTI